MWDTDDTVSNGAWSDAAPSPVNGTAQCEHNNMPAGAINYCLSSSSENCAARHVPSKFASENLSSSKCVISEASDISALHGAASTSADSDARPPASASVTCHSGARTSRHLYNNHETDDDDGYFASNIDWNTQSTPNGATGDVCKSLCSDYFSYSDVCLQSSFPQTSVNETVHCESDASHAYACQVNDCRCTENEQILVGAEADTSASIPANSDLCDDGYLDEIDDVTLSAVDMHRPSDSTAWFVETDTCLDDFIDADMPHNAAVAGSTSTSSLSSTHEELNRMLENGSDNTPDRLTDHVIYLSGSDVADNSQQRLQENLWQGSSSEEHATAVSNCTRFGSHGQIANGTHASQTQTCDTVTTHSWHEINMQTSTANSATDSSHYFPPESLPSFSDNYYITAGNGELAETAASEQLFEDRAQSGEDTAVRKPSDTSETSDRPTSPKQSECHWLPVGTESDMPKFVCWSCFEAMNSANLSLPAEYVTPSSRLRLADTRDTGVMSRSATADYSSHDHSDLLMDDGENSFASVLSARMFSSLTL